jgi:circadian clock protein KaiB
MCAPEYDGGVMGQAKDVHGRFDADLASARSEHYVLRLYVSGATARSTRAVANIKRICEEKLEGRYELEIIDIYQQPVLARDEQIIATPTLIKQLPPPLRKFIGDLSNTERILVGLDLRPKPESRSD